MEFSWFVAKEKIGSDLDGGPVCHLPFILATTCSRSFQPALDNLWIVFFIHRQHDPGGAVPALVLASIDHLIDVVRVAYIHDGVLPWIGIHPPVLPLDAIQ